jgi:hypothetical protein
MLYRCMSVAVVGRRRKKIEMVDLQLGSTIGHAIFCSHQTCTSTSGSSFGFAVQPFLTPSAHPLSLDLLLAFYSSSSIHSVVQLSVHPVVHHHLFSPHPLFKQGVCSSHLSPCFAKVLVMSQQRQRLQSSSSRTTTTTTTNIRSRAPFRTRPGLPLLIAVYFCLILTLSVLTVYADEIAPPNGAHAIENFDLYYGKFSFLPTIFHFHQELLLSEGGRRGCFIIFPTSSQIVVFF